MGVGTLRLIWRCSLARLRWEETMTKPSEEKGRDALATFAEIARKKGARRLTATPENSLKSGNLAVEDPISGSIPADVAAIGLILVPSSPPVPTATAKQKQNDDDDEKSCHIHGYLL
jgi:hypothetical protein